MHVIDACTCCARACALPDNALLNRHLQPHNQHLTTYVMMSTCLGCHAAGRGFVAPARNHDKTVLQFLHDFVTEACPELLSTSAFFRQFCLPNVFSICPGHFPVIEVSSFHSKPAATNRHVATQATQKNRAHTIRVLNTKHMYQHLAIAMVPMQGAAKAMEGGHGHDIKKRRRALAGAPGATPEVLRMPM
jgi:hypothetical protein